MPGFVEAQVTVEFGGTAFATNAMAVAIDGARFALAANAGLDARIASGLTNVTLAPTRVAVASGLGARLDGQMTLTVAFAAGATPRLTLYNVSGGAPAVSWPTGKGPAMQALTPGTAMPLDGIVGAPA